MIYAKFSEQILRQYTKLAIWSEEKKGYNRYMIATGLCIMNHINSIAYNTVHNINKSSNVQPLSFSEHPIMYSVATTIGNSMAILFFHDTVYSIYCMLNKKDNQSSEIAIDKIIYYSTKIQRAARLPIIGLLIGSGLVIYDGIINKDYKNITAGIGGAVTTFCLSSSMYIKDSKPKILDKAPFWKEAYNWITKTFSREQNPIKIPIKHYNETEIF